MWRYPVKGLSGERLEQAEVAAGGGLPFDRVLALLHGTAEFDPAAPAFLPKSNFLVLARHPRLAALATLFDPQSRVLEVRRGGKTVCRADLSQPMGATVLEQFFAAYMNGELRGRVRLVEAPGHRFFDVPQTGLTLLNLASVRDLERVVGRPVDPARFRASLWIEGLPAWQEFGWVGRSIAIGGVRLAITGRVDRCAATNVSPATAEVDMNIPKALMQGYGHVDMAVYATVETGGRLVAGAALAVA
ncbi:MAG: MOSC domain-containing protein [Thalassobaculales bacterium]